MAAIDGGDNIEMSGFRNRVRFEIEDVDDSNQISISVDPVTSPVQHSFTSLAYNTSEAVPNTLYYRNEENDGQSRPSLETLRLGQAPFPVISGGDVGDENILEDDDSQTVSKWWNCCRRFRKKSNEPKKPKKLGWIMGVLVRCLLNIWGVMLFIRLSWIVGHAGVGLASIVVLLAAVVTVVTTLSMSAICTNGEVKGGGAYYMISRSLGPEFGGAIGVIFSLANAVAVALYIVGFAETLTELLERHGSLIPGLGMDNHIRIFGAITLILLLSIALIGLDWESKIQIVLLVILLISMADALIGSFIPRQCDHEDTLQGFTFYNLGTFADNFVPQFEDGESFFSIFAVFFPAATGILAGANISGDLKDPQSAIPKGTLLAIAISTVVYLCVVFLVGFTVVRDAPGTPAMFLGSFQSNITCGSNFTDFISYCSDSIFNLTSVNNYNEFCDQGIDGCTTLNCDYGNVTRADYKAICADGNCQFGLLNYFQVMEMLSAYGPIVTAGIFAATLSSALASFVSAPKVFQRVCQDKIFPFIHFFAKGGGRSGTEPTRGYLLTFVIALACIAIGDLNIIALVISTFFLMAYTLINFSCFAASFTRTPGWRPAFRFYSKWVALAGSAICLAIMFVISWWAALITLVAIGALYFIVYWRKPDINWGSSTQAFLYAYAMRNLQKLEKLEDHVKNFRPQYLVLSGPPSSRPDLVLFASHLANEVGIMVCGHVIKGDYTNNRHVLLSNQQKKWLRSKRIKGFYNGVCADNIGQGVRSLLQLSGLGKLRPNTVVIGYKTNWKTSTEQEIEEYVNIIHDSFDLLFGVIIFRLRAGFDATDDTSDPAKDFNLPELHVPARRANDSPQLLATSTDEVRQSSPINKNDDRYGQGLTEVSLHSSDPIHPSPPTLKSPDILNLSILSTRSYQRIDDDEESDHDGDDVVSTSLDSYKAAVEYGVNLLSEEHTATITIPEMPEIVSMPSRFEVKQESGYIDVWWLYDDGGLAMLIPFLLSQHPLWKNCKLRIFTAGSSRNIDSARLKMASLLKKFRIKFSDVIEITDLSKRPTKDSIDKYLALPLDNGVEENSLDKKTLRHIRLGELLHEHSAIAKLIVITISVPRRSISPRHYMSWLETMSWNLPPVLLMRGNQSSVLTFYS